MKKQTDHIPMQVLMTTDTIGGVWTYSVELCKALDRFNVHFHLVTMGALMQPAQRAEIARLGNVTVYETDFLLEWMEAPWKSIDAAGKWLLNLAKNIQPDLLHLNNYTHGALAWEVPVLIVAHSDVFSWWLAVKQTYPPPEWNEYRRRVSKGLHRADFLIAPSHAMLNETQRIFDVSVPAKVIYNTRGNGLFSQGKKQPVVFSCGRLWDEAKNIPLLIDAEKHLRHPVRIAGDSSFEYTNAISLGGNIIQLGKLTPTAIAEEMSTASVYALPARYEPFGLSVLEAALSGCALVLGNIPSLKEIWGNSALYVSPDDAHQLAETINHLLDNESERNVYAAKALNRAKYFNPIAMATSYRMVYEKLLEPEHAPSTSEKLLR